MDKEIKITPPEGYEIDKENSTFECIKFKKKEQKSWRYDDSRIVTGYILSSSSSNILAINECHKCINNKSSYNVFATKAQAKSAIAMARISQIMANDKRFGEVVTDEEWNRLGILKYVIINGGGKIYKTSSVTIHYFLAFHTIEQRDLFLKENEDLVKDYLMIN